MKNNIKTTSGMFLMAMMISANGVTPAAADAIAEQRALQVSARPEQGSVGMYGIPMQVLVASGNVEPSSGWDKPETATWNNDGHDVATFLADEMAQREAFAFYLNGLYEHLHTKAVDLSVEVDGQKLYAQDLLGLTAFGIPPYKIAILAQEKDAAVLDEQAANLGFGSGSQLLLSLVDHRDDNDIEFT